MKELLPPCPSPCSGHLYFHTFKDDREPVLESRLRSGQISVGEFVRGLLHSSKFRDDFVPLQQQLPHGRSDRRPGNGVDPSGSGNFSLPQPEWLSDPPSPLARKIWQGLGRWFRPDGLRALRRRHHAQHPHRGLIGA